MSVKEKPVITVRTVRNKPGWPGDMSHQLQLIGRSGRILGLCKLRRYCSRKYRYYESDNYGPTFATLAEWREWAEKNMDTLAPEFCEAERDWLPPLIMGIPVCMQP